ncbi:MAG: hypothetical protein A2Y15_00410 [Clostridiales bacterium GWF2_36_10]|nr:MAG: hypothetical protein A2Y15_00410 [Clostridiales bacterium GWF2_36_10]HAN21748.1 hypothetical protein [Clostridiales bacterium]
MKKLIIMLLCIIILTGTLASCSTLKEGEKGATISVYLSQYPYTLDPALVQLNSDVSELLGLIFEPLTTIDEDGKVVGALAEEWYYFFDKRDEEHKMYFSLKETAWSDGRAVSAQDVVDAWKRILSPETQSPYASMLYPLKNAKAVKTGVMTTDDLGLAAEDDKLLSVTFEKEYDINLFAATVSNIHLAPIRDDLLAKALKEEDEKNQDWAGTATIACNGPYRVQAYDEGIRLVLERNQYYLRDVEDDALDKYILPYRIVCLYQEDIAENSENSDSLITQIEFQTKRFEDGNTFYIGGFNKDTYVKYSDDMVTSRTLNSYNYYFNTENEVLSEPKVRQALSIALDRNEIVKDITGTGEVAATGYVPFGVFDTGSEKEDFRTVGGDIYKTGDNNDARIQEAKKLLNEVNVKSGSFKLTYLIPESKALINKYKDEVIFTNVYLDIANYAKSVWEELGFKVELVGLNPKDYLEALYNSDFDVLGINNIMDSIDAFAYLAPFSKFYSGTKVSVNFETEAYAPHYTKLASDEYDALIDSIVFESEGKKRSVLLHDAETKFNELCPATAVFYYSSSYVKSDDLSNVEVSFFGFKMLNDLKLKNYREINAKEEEASAEAESKANAQG